MNTYLAILQLDITKKNDYTPNDIRRAFKKQAMKWHPDRNSHQTERATDKMKDINEANAYLIQVFETLQEQKKEILAKKKDKPNNDVPNKRKNNENDVKFKEQKERECQIRQQKQENELNQQLNQQLNKERRENQQKQNEKDDSIEKECIHWKKIMAKSLVNESEIDFLITAKIVFVDLFRGDMKDSSLFNNISFETKTQIAEIWFQFPVCKGNCKYVKNFGGESYIIQCIHSSNTHDFYSHHIIQQYLKQRAYHYLNFSTGPNLMKGINKQELNIILSLLQNWETNIFKLN